MKKIHLKTYEEMLLGGRMEEILWRCMERQATKKIGSWKCDFWRRCFMPKGNTPEEPWPVKECMSWQEHWDT